LKILLDECIDRRFAREFAHLEVFTVPQMGWAGIKNGELMKLAEAKFDIFVTVDRNLSYQQNLPKYAIALIVLKARSNRYIDLIPFAEPVLDSLSNVSNGEAFLITID
jgi:predicted nuclease of predicted toxin-antitoxin system